MPRCCQLKLFYVLSIYYLVSLKSVTRHNRSSHPINESSEATPLLPPCSADSGIVKDDQLHCMSTGVLYMYVYLITK